MAVPAENGIATFGPAFERFMRAQEMQRLVRAGVGPAARMGVASAAVAATVGTAKEEEIPAETADAILGRTG